MLPRLQARIADVHVDAPHKFTTSVTRRFHTISIEEPNVRRMLACGWVSGLTFGHDLNQILIEYCRRADAKEEFASQ